jgi:hypothetical protein
VINPIKLGTTLSVPKQVNLDRRPPVQISLGCHVEGVARPHPDPLDPLTTQAGVRMRFARAPPSPNPRKMKRLAKFVRTWVKENLTPLAADTDLSIESWLESTSYPRKRKDELLEKMDKFTHLDDSDKKYKMCKSFMKDECYDEYKHARGINSRSDEFKCIVGPIFKKIEEEVYKHEAFIKHVPVAERPKYIMDMLYTDGAQYGVTDYTAFESLFTKQLMTICEFEMYNYMTMNLAENAWFMKICKEVLGGTNVCEFKTFVVKLLATRMSGEMCTSLGNGFSNLMFMLFLCEEIGSKNTKGVVEGDDGLFRTQGRFPTRDEFAELGLNIKIETKDSLAEASFCGILFDPDDQINITDVKKVVASFGWTTRQYANANKHTLKKLLRCKSLSFAYQYPGCPIISSLAQYGLRVTRSYDVSRFLDRMKTSSYYHMEILRLAVKDEKNIQVLQPPMKTRLLVERLYGISVEQQLSVEAYLDGLEDVTPLCPISIDSDWPAAWLHYWNTYSGKSKKPDDNDPGNLWTQFSSFRKEW